MLASTPCGSGIVSFLSVGCNKILKCSKKKRREDLLVKIEDNISVIHFGILCQLLNHGWSWI